VTNGRSYSLAHVTPNLTTDWRKWQITESYGHISFFAHCAQSTKLSIIHTDDGTFSDTGVHRREFSLGWETKSLLCCHLSAAKRMAQKPQDSVQKEHT